MSNLVKRADVASIIAKMSTNEAVDQVWVGNHYSLQNALDDLNALLTTVPDDKGTSCMK